jgi:hypothetical protein
MNKKINVIIKKIIVSLLGFTIMAFGVAYIKFSPDPAEKRLPTFSVITACHSKGVPHQVREHEDCI